MKFPPPILLILCALAAGCGQKGPLYLPEETAGEVVTRPGPSQPAESPEADTSERDEDGESDRQ